MDKLDYVKKRVQNKELWSGIFNAKIVSQRTLYKIINGHLPSYRTVSDLYDYFKAIGK